MVLGFLPCFCGLPVMDDYVRISSVQLVFLTALSSLNISMSSLIFCHRMIPPSSKNFLVNNLAAGTQYDLCVLAIYDDVITSLTATRVVGCVQFTTESEYMRCHFMQSQVLGGTMIIIIGGIIVASVLVFIIILMIRYKVGSHVSPDQEDIDAG